MSDSTPIIQYADSSGNRAYAYTHWKAITGVPQVLIDAINKGFPSGDSGGKSVASVLLVSPNGTNFKLTVNDDGRLITTKVTT
ncbi:hypothetical protein [Convivina praedatoris]|uniref:hypothetical protein n=1 Tax=Convivina praedatoris TaxID=2880963 RepID=UPI00200EEE2C|nr:hypothetical protein [Convivina sp. LMG 32447]CAH1855114.1 hypothetical protein R078138_01062 [Convivina sp. LMG 32447]